MRLQKVEVKNFKYHKEITLDCEGKNFLAYGENGAGKTSVFRAIYSLLYHHKDSSVRDQSYRDLYINKNSLTEDLVVKVFFDEQDNKIIRQNGEVSGRESIKASAKAKGKLYERFPEEHANIFMFEAKDLDQLLEGSFDQKIAKHFSSEYEVETIYRELNVLLSAGNKDGLPEEQYRKKLVDIKAKLDFKYKNEIISLIDEDEINKILENKFHWKEKAIFEIADSEIDFSNQPYKFNAPIVKLSLKNDPQKASVVEYLNEAKLKVLALTMYLCGILKQPKRATNILVLDDFVNSLDMANRRFIVDALVSNLENYQFLIFTHNIHFYELIKKVLGNFGQKKKWVFQKLVSFSEGADFVLDSSDYMNQAKEQLEQGDFEASANYLRKQFELICHRHEVLLNLGRHEELSVMLDALKRSGDFYIQPNKLIMDIIKIFKKFNKDVANKKLSAHIGIAKEFEDKVDSMRFAKGENTALLKEITLMKDILLNPASHSNQQVPVHKAECEYAYQLLSELTSKLDAIT